MTQTEIIEMALQARWLDWEVVSQKRELKAFAKLVAEKEREACAKLFDDRNTGTGFYEPHEPAEIIRARGQE